MLSHSFKIHPEAMRRRQLNPCGHLGIPIPLIQLGLVTYE